MCGCYETFQVQNTLDIFLKNDDILFITGSPGIGKTSLSREILKDKIITEINTLNIKSNYKNGLAESIETFQL